MNLFGDPRIYYGAFAESITNDIEKGDGVFAAVQSILSEFNHELNSDYNEDAKVASVIDEIVDQGMIELISIKLDEVAFVKMIDIGKPKSRMSSEMTKSLMTLIETIINIIGISDKARSKATVFLPYLLRDIVGIQENQCHLKIVASKLINSLVDDIDTANDEICSIKSQKTIREDIGSLLMNADDFELQALILEIAFRIIQPQERSEYVHKWFESEELRKLFLSIQDNAFEPGCRRFLNQLNNNNPNQKVFSMPSHSVFFGNEKVALAKDTAANRHWVDINLGSETVKFFVEEKEEGNECWWHTVVIERNNVLSCVLMQAPQHSPTIKLTLKEDAAKLIPSLREHGERTVFIRLGPEFKLDQKTFNDLFHKLKWVSEEFLSPKSSVAIGVVRCHKGNRNNETSSTSKVRSTNEEDIQGSDYPSSLTGLSQETSSQPSSQTSNYPQDNQEDKNMSDKSKDEKHQNVGENTKDLDPKGDQSGPLKEQNKDNDKASSSTARVEDKLTTASLNKKRDKSSDSSTDSSSSKESVGRRTRSKNAKTSSQHKKTKSPLPVEIRKSATPSKRSTSSSSDDERPHASETRKSAFNIAKEIQKDTSKVYPKAFNVAKRMEAKKAIEMTRSQQLTKKVFGQKASRSFYQKNQKGENERQSKTLPSIASRPEMEDTECHTSSLNSSIKAPLSSKNVLEKEKLSQTIPEAATKSTQSKAIIRSGIDESTDDKDSTGENEIDVIQDSLPLEDSPNKTISIMRRPIKRKGHSRQILERPLIKSAPPIVRTKRHISFTHIPPRLGAMLCKGGIIDTHGSCMEKAGSGSSSSGSSSESDWPGPYGEPGPKPKHSLVPRKSIRKEKGEKTHSIKERVVKKRASISPGLSAIEEEGSPKDAVNVDQQKLPHGGRISEKRKTKSTMRTDKFREKKTLNESTDSEHEKRRNKKSCRESGERQKQHQNEVDDFPDLEVEQYPKDDDTHSEEFVQQDKNSQSVQFVDETSLKQGTFISNNHRKYNKEITSEAEEETVKEKIIKNPHKARGKRQDLNYYDWDTDNDEIDNKYESSRRARRSTSHNVSLRKRANNSFSDDYDEAENETDPQKKTVLKSSRRKGTLLKRGFINEKHENMKEKRPRKNTKSLTYNPEDDFDSLQDDSPTNELETKKSPIKMLSPPRAEKRKKLRKSYTPQSSKMLMNRNLSDNEDNEATKLRQFCENIHLGRRITSTPASQKFDELMQDCKEAEAVHKNDLDDEIEPQKRLKIARKPTTTKAKDHATARLNPSTTLETTNERFGRIQPGKLKTPEQRHLDDSGIGTGPRSLKSAYKSRQKGELLVTKSIGKTPITPRTSAIMKRIDEEETNERNADKVKRKSLKLAEWTSSGPSKQRVKREDDEDLEEEEIQPYVYRLPKRSKEKPSIVHNPHIKPRKLFKEQNVYFAEENEPYGSSDDSVAGDISSIMSDLKGVLNDRLRRKRNHLQRFCRKTFDVTLHTVSSHLDQSLTSRDQLVETFNDQFVNEMNTLKDEIETSKKNELEIMARIQDDLKVLKTARVIQEKKVKNLQSLCMEFQSDLKDNSKSHPDQQGELQDNIRQELANVQREFMREAHSQDRENLRRSLRSVLDVTMM